jgi:rubredoxin
MNERIGATTRLECKICWFVYDPQDGDEVAQIPPGTSFKDLPVHWRCPQCDADRDHFLPLDDA